MGFAGACLPSSEVPEPDPAGDVAAADLSCEEAEEEGLPSPVPPYRNVAQRHEDIKIGLETVESSPLTVVR